MCSSKPTRPAITGEEPGLRGRPHGRTELAADLVVMAVGIRPNTGLARSAGLACNRGIVVDDHMRTSDSAIFAVGECVEHRGLTYGLVAPLFEMCKAAAGALVGNSSAGYPGSTQSVKVTGIEVFSAGSFAEGTEHEDIVFRDATKGIYKRLVIKDDRLIGAVLYGDTRDGAWYFQLLKDATPLETCATRSSSARHGVPGASKDRRPRLTALPAEAEICGCNGVSKATIVSAIAAMGFPASKACGRRPRRPRRAGPVRRWSSTRRLQAGDSYTADPKSSRCAPARSWAMTRCAAGLLKELRLDSRRRCTSSAGARRTAVLLPAGAELLSALRLARANIRTTSTVRFINERAHANIQKDGTYSVVPRMWGGVTNPRSCAPSRTWRRSSTSRR